jgi:flavodoxin
MNALVIYDSKFGNTEQIARVIANTLSESGQARAVRVDPTQPVDFQGVDLLILGCPTQGWRPTPAMQTFLGNVSPKSQKAMVVACFDTRFSKPRWMTGSAARVMDKKLRGIGVLPALPPESFFVDKTEGPLVSGELERAAKWARVLREKIEAPHLAVG